MVYYNTAFECRYHRDDVFLPTDGISQEEKDFVRNVLFREDLLNIFELDDEEGDGMHTMVSLLYEKIKQCPPLMQCMEMAASKYGFSTDCSHEVGLFLMFSFDLLYLTHPCICSFLNHGHVDEGHFTALLNALKKE